MDVEIPLHSPYLPPPNGIDHIYQNRRQTFDISNKNLSSDVERMRIAEHCYQRVFNSVDEIPKPLATRAAIYMRSNSLSDGCVLTQPSMLIIFGADGRLFHYF